MQEIPYFDFFLISSGLLTLILGLTDIYSLFNLSLTLYKKKKSDENFSEIPMKEKKP